MSAEWGQDEAPETPPAPPEEPTTSEDTWSETAPDAAEAEETSAVETFDDAAADGDDTWSDEPTEAAVEDSPEEPEEPEAVAEEPEAVAEEPEAVAEEPEAVAEEPAEPEAVAEEPEAVAEEPEAVAEEPEAVAEAVAEESEEPGDAAEEPTETAAEEPEASVEEPETEVEEPEEPDEVAEETHEPDEVAEEPQEPDQVAEEREDAAEEPEDATETTEASADEAQDQDDTWAEEPTEAEAEDNPEATEALAEEPDEAAETTEPAAASGEDQDDTWAEEPTDVSLDDAADRKMAEDIAALRAEQEILRDQGNLDAIADIDSFIDRLPVNDEIKSDPEAYLERVRGGDADATNTQKRPDGAAEGHPEDALDRRMAEDIISLRAEQEILRQQGNLQAVGEIDSFIGRLPVDDRIRADPQGYLDGRPEEASQREQGLEILRQHFENLGGEVYGRGQDTQSGRGYFERTEPLDSFVQKLPAADGVYTLALHGSPDAAYVSGVPVTAGEVADMIRADPKFAGAEVIHLHSCQTGAGRDCFAQQLANDLGIPVEAPTNYAWLDRDGNAWVSGLEWVSQPGDTYAARPMASTAADRWETFLPQTDARGTTPERPAAPEDPVTGNPDDAAASGPGRLGTAMLVGTMGAHLAGAVPDGHSPVDNPVAPPPVVQQADEVSPPGDPAGDKGQVVRAVDQAPRGSPHQGRHAGGGDSDDDDPNEADKQVREAVEGALRRSDVRRQRVSPTRPGKPAPRDNRPKPYRRKKGPR